MHGIIKAQPNMTCEPEEGEREGGQPRGCEEGFMEEARGINPFS